MFCFFKQKTAYDWRSSDCSSDVGSSDLELPADVDGNVLLAAARDGLLHNINGRISTACCAALAHGRASLQICFRTLRTTACSDRCGKIGRASYRERLCQYG